jgi:hypothetical protein
MLDMGDRDSVDALRCPALALSSWLPGVADARASRAIRCATVELADGAFEDLRLAPPDGPLRCAHYVYAYASKANGAGRPSNG